MGTTTPTAQQIANIRADMGLIASALTEPEITAFWGRVSGASDEVTQHEATLALMARAALTGAINLHDYSTGNQSEKLSQQWDNIRRIYDMFKSSLEQAMAKSQIALGAIRPARAKDEQPQDSGSTLDPVHWSWQDLAG